MGGIKHEEFNEEDPWKRLQQEPCKKLLPLQAEDAQDQARVWRHR